jgi:hypothetical protein
LGPVESRLLILHIAEGFQRPTATHEEPTMTRPQPTQPVWRKSSRSDNNGGACLEVADLGETIGVRDSVNRDAGVIRVGRAAWMQFIDAVRCGGLNRQNR